MTKSKKEEPEEEIIPTIAEGSSELGTIRINHSVVAGIVRLATQSVKGVVNVGGGGVVEGLTDFFSKKESMVRRICCQCRKAVCLPCFPASERGGQQRSRICFDWLTML